MILRKIKNFIRHASKSEKGVALIFTLGILSLLLILAMSFATSSITERKVAANNYHTTSARLLAESSLNKIMRLIGAYDAGIYFSHSESSTTLSGTPSANQGKYDFLWKLQTTGIFEWQSSYSNSNAFNWDFVTITAPDGTKRIIGRTGYVVIPGGGVDPAALVKASFNEGTTYEERYGVDVNEINLRDIGVTASAATDMSYTTGGGKLTGTSWGDFPTLFKAIGAMDDQTLQEKFHSWFVVNSKDEPEAFWIDKNSNKSIDIIVASGSEELYHRFNLLLDDTTSGLASAWNTNTFDIATHILAAPTAWSNVTAHNGYSIPWLKYWTEKGTFADGPTRGKQIAANLKDYCDTDSKPTSDKQDISLNPDWAVETSSTKIPSYTGNEKTPYINEIAVVIEAVADMQNPVAGVYDYSFVIKGSIGAELINIYGNDSTSLTETFSNAASIKASGIIELTYYNGTTAQSNFTTTLLPNANYPEFTSGTGNSPYKYQWGTPFTIVSATSPGDTVAGKRDVSNVKVTINNVMLTYNGIPVDYAKINPSAPLEITSLIPAGSGTLTQYGLYVFEAKDPRQNLNSGDWITRSQAVKTTDPRVDTTTYNTVGSYEAVNHSEAYPNSGSDPETVADPAWINATNHLSTAYLRNDVMKSPWELGCIHRGAAWETINLKAFNDNAGVLDAKGGDVYALGDANILDQIKMTKNTIGRMKFSLKIQQDELLKALLKRVSVNTTYNAPIDINKYLADATVTTLTGKIKAQSITDFYTRGCLAKVTDLGATSVKYGSSSDPLPATDAAKEEIIGKLANITSITRTSYFTVIILAQSINDVGSSTGTDVYKDLNNNGVIDTSATVYAVDGASNNRTVSERITGCKLGEYDFMADEIMSEQKIKVDLYKNLDTGLVSIIKIEYLED